MRADRVEMAVQEDQAEAAGAATMRPAGEAQEHPADPVVVAVVELAAAADRLSAYSMSTAPKPALTMSTGSAVAPEVAEAAAVQAGSLAEAAQVPAPVNPAAQV